MLHQKFCSKRVASVIRMALQKTLKFDEDDSGQPRQCCWWSEDRRSYSYGPGDKVNMICFYMLRAEKLDFNLLIKVSPLHLNINN